MNLNANVKWGELLLIQALLLAVNLWTKYQQEIQQ